MTRNGAGHITDPSTRRRFLATAGAAGASALLAGCSAEQTNGDETPTDPGDGTETEPGATAGSDGPDTLVVGTYDSFVDAPSTSPGAWIKETFESEFDATLVWQTPPNDVNYYIERAEAGVETDADVYVGLNADDLVRIDDAVSEPLFDDPGELTRRDRVRDGLEFDPEGRAVPYDTGYISLVYDSTETEAPETFEGLLEEDHRGELIAQNPGQSTTGRAFLLHTIHRYGDDYLDFWADLQENDVRVLGSWNDAYSAWMGGEAPMVVSYSTDQVFASQEGADLDEHQIRFLDGEGYANPEGMARFTDANAPDLAQEFLAFMLRADVQGEIAQRNVQFPATDDAELPEEYSQYAHEPPTAVTFGYDELAEGLEGWISGWERQFAGN
ncbi:thiamine ABC transporter substrate-binding protein [Halalkaliarchaeum sp. AArc-CO]|uniref:thiamine ABC transporter substrate-binding protein n=1 Tax=Halalkaliarchaeum sp. AArc-CO TaxID=2866381 RepID=UPI00217F02F5|nr:thiamine ABC transporter substrate-binding protein [Halalkaliarchaeum sp. AArc-CO]